MKKLLVLAGGSLRNKVWGEACVNYFKNQFDVTFLIHYDHWESGESNINFETELEKIAQRVKEAGEEGEWYIYAKSIGSILALKAVDKGLIVPTKCVFFGMPFSVVMDTVVKSEFQVITSFSVNTLAIHNLEDPTAIFDVTKKIVEQNMPTVTLVTMNANNHDYLDFSLYKTDIDSFTKS